METAPVLEKCGVVIDQSDSKDIECDAASILTNEGVPLCGIHAVAYYREGLLTEASTMTLSEHVEKHAESFLFR